MSSKQLNGNQRAKRIVFTMGGKGGTGKTTFMASLCEYYEKHGVPFELLDLDTENKRQGSLSHFFPRARKMDPAGETGLDFYLDILGSDIDVLLADMGAGQGAVTYRWFDTIHEHIRELAHPLFFTAVGVVTYDPASMESVLTWANHLNRRVDYLIVKNTVRDHAGFPVLESDSVKEFVRNFNPTVIGMPLRIAEYEQLARTHGLTPGAVAEGRTDIPELKRLGIQIRAAGYRKAVESQLLEVNSLLVAPSPAAVA